MNICLTDAFTNLIKIMIKSEFKHMLFLQNQMKNIGIPIFPKRFRYSRSIVYVNANYRSFIFIITSVIQPSIAQRVSNDTETMVHIYADCWDANQFFLPILNSFPNICNSDIMRFEQFSLCLISQHTGLSLKQQTENKSTKQFVSIWIRMNER